MMYVAIWMAKMIIGIIAGAGRVILITDGIVRKVRFIWQETVKLAPVSDLEFDDIEGRNSDTGVEAYLVSRSLAGGISRRGTSGR